MISLEQRAILGKMVASSYANQGIIKIWYNYEISKEPEGEFRTISYPKRFIPFMDREIKKFYEKYIKLKTPVYSAKPSPKQL